MRRFILLGIIVALLALPVATVHAAPPPDGPPGLERAIEAQEKHSSRLLATPGVVGTAVSMTANGKPVVKIFTENAGVRGLPASLEGVPVEVQVTGKLVALKKPKDPPGKPPEEDGPSTTDRWERPVPIGVSTGSFSDIVCLAGTIGARITDGTDVYALSNNHVYALENQALPGSFVVQPGMVDAGCVYDEATLEANLLGVLYPYIELDFVTGINLIDAAIAYTSTDVLGNSTPSWGYGTPKSATVPAYIGQRVQKFGRTTELTRGTVTGVNAIVEVGYRNGTAVFFEQIIVQTGRKPFIGAGDSGSLLVTHPHCNPVGLLFAGTSSGTLAVANKIDLVLYWLGVVNGGKTLTIDGN